MTTPFLPWRAALLGRVEPVRLAWESLWLGNEVYRCIYPLELAVGKNGPKGMMRSHYAVHTQRSKALWTITVTAGKWKTPPENPRPLAPRRGPFGKRPAGFPRRRVEVTRYTAGTLDPLGRYSTCELVVDALVRARVLWDDNDDGMVLAEPKVEKAEKGWGCVLVRVSNEEAS